MNPQGGQGQPPAKWKSARTPPSDRPGVRNLPRRGGKNGYQSPQDDFQGEPLKWNKVHNLPDHVFFSHQQHVVVGGLEYQNCHGDVGKYTVGRIAPVEEINTLVDDFPDYSTVQAHPHHGMVHRATTRRSQPLPLATMRTFTSSSRMTSAETRSSAATWKTKRRRSRNSAAGNAPSATIDHLNANRDLPHG